MTEWPHPARWQGRRRASAPACAWKLAPAGSTPASFCSSPLPTLAPHTPRPRCPLSQNRRAALGALAGAAALVSGAAPSFAEYGDSANVFGRVTNKSGFVPYAGEGFAILLPSKWNPSKEKDFPNVQLR